jgi:hypothetical protein
LGGREVELCYEQDCSTCEANEREVGEIVCHYPRALLNLLQVCRQLHTEAKLISFSTNTFIAIPAEMELILSGHFSKEQLNAMESLGLQIFGAQWCEVLTGIAPVEVGPALVDSFTCLDRVQNLRTLSLLWERTFEKVETSIEEQTRFEQELLGRAREESNGRIPQGTSRSS